MNDLFSDLDFEKIALERLKSKIPKSITTPEAHHAYVNAKSEEEELDDDEEPLKPPTSKKRKIDETGGPKKPPRERTKTAPTVDKVISPPAPKISKPSASKEDGSKKKPKGNVDATVKPKQPPQNEPVQPPPPQIENPPQNGLEVAVKKQRPSKTTIPITKRGKVKAIKCALQMIEAKMERLHELNGFTGLFVGHGFAIGANGNLKSEKNEYGKIPVEIASLTTPDIREHRNLPHAFITEILQGLSKLEYTENSKEFEKQNTNNYFYNINYKKEKPEPEKQSREPEDDEDDYEDCSEGDDDDEDDEEDEPPKTKKFIKK